MNSVSEECQQLKEQYDTCFNKWFSEKYLKGIETDECQHLFKKYQACVYTAIKSNGIQLEDAMENVLGTGKEKQVPKDWKPSNSDNDKKS